MAHRCSYNELRHLSRWAKQALISELQMCDFFCFVKDLQETRAEIIRSNDIFTESVCRSFDLDTENLSEQGVGVLFLESANALKCRGITIPKWSETVSENGTYEVSMNERVYPIWGQDTSDKCYDGAIAAMVIVQNLLSKQKRGEELYFDAASGNDGRVFLLTPQMFTVLSYYKVLNGSGQL